MFRVRTLIAAYLITVTMFAALGILQYRALMLQPAFSGPSGKPIPEGQPIEAQLKEAMVDSFHKRLPITVFQVEYTLTFDNGGEEMTPTQKEIIARLTGPEGPLGRRAIYEWSIRWYADFCGRAGYSPNDVQRMSNLDIHTMMMRAHRFMQRDLSTFIQNVCAQAGEESIII
jgi:hypothetical protein